jgi:hypothetical protein
MLYCPYMNKMNKNSILAYVFMVVIVFAGAISMPNETMAASSKTCTTKGVVCGSDTDKSGKNTSAKNTFTQTFNYSPGACGTGGVSCGSQIDLTAGNNSTAPNTSFKSTNPGSSNKSGTSSDSENPVPIIYSVNPEKLAPGTGDTMVSIVGDNFTPSSVAKWNSEERETIYINPTHLAVKLNSEDLEKSGEYLLTVFNKSPGGGYSNSMLFTLGDGETAATGGATTNKNGSSLAGSAILGADSFLPFSLINWLIFMILILLGVVLWRKIYFTKEKKEAPLKHA